MVRKRSMARCLAACASAFLSSQGQAQVDPGSIERTVPKIDVRPIKPGQQMLAPVTSPQSANVAGRFVLSAVIIDGATAFTSADLAQSFEPFLASEVGQAELEKIAADITDRYRRAGYVLSFAIIPEQSVRSGIVHIRIVEGYVSDVQVQGDSHATAAVRPVIERLKSERPLRAATLERMLGLARDLPGVVLGESRISRAADEPARHTLLIIVGANRIRALGYSDNRGTIDGARVRGYTALNVASLVKPGDELEVDLFAIPSHRFRYLYGQVKASVPIGTDGLRFAATTSYGDQLQRLGQGSQKGYSSQTTAEISYPFAKSRALSLIGHASLSAWRSQDKLGGSLIQRDRVQVVRAWLEVAKVTKTRFDARIGLSQGIDLDHATRVGDPLASRPYARGQFTKLNAELQISRPISERLRLRFDTIAQFSSKSLLAPEEFSLGGSRIGRAFDFNEATGDHGFGSAVELAYRLPDGHSRFQSTDIFTFVDGGGAFRDRASSGFPGSQWLASLGGGIRTTAFGFAWSAEVGAPIARNRVDRNVRAFVSIARVL